MGAGEGERVHAIGVTMINTIKGDLLTAKGLILHGVNCQGVMGSGVALAIRNKWPEVFQAYVYYVGGCGGPENADSYIGTVHFVGTKDESVVVANCFTQNRYGKDGKKYASYDAIDSCMQSVREYLERNADEPVNFPLIGCGLGGLHWPVVREIIEHRIPDTFTKNLYVL